MKKISVMILCAVSAVLFSSCSLLSDTFRPAYGSLPEGVYESKEGNWATGYKNLYIDGEYHSYTSIDMRGVEKTLTILPGNKVTYSQKEYQYYEEVEKDVYVTLNPPLLLNTRWDDCNGSYKLGKKKMVMFDFNVEPDYDGIKRGPLLSGSAWEYQIDGNSFVLTRRARLGEGGDRESFTKVQLPE